MNAVDRVANRYPYVLYAAQIYQELKKACFLEFKIELKSFNDSKFEPIFGSRFLKH